MWNLRSSNDSKKQNIQTTIMERHRHNTIKISKSSCPNKWRFQQQPNKLTKRWINYYKEIRSWTIHNDTDKT